MANYVSVQNRARIVERAGGCCEYCRTPRHYSPDPFSVEHIHPQSQGGSTTLDNLALSYQGCNGHKSTKTVGIDPIMGRSTLLYNPRQQHWRDHFAWSANFTLAIGLTPIGRATVETLVRIFGLCSAFPYPFSIKPTLRLKFAP